MTAHAEAVLRGDRREAARLLSRAEAMDTSIVDDLKMLYRAGGRAHVLGITGPPGAGKSTLVDLLIARHRKAGRRVAVLAFDPSSPLTSGAILGDRVRMSRHAEDAGVLIRSMATRGDLGGLAAAAGDAVIILDAMGFDHIIIETVGVGQSETDVIAHADTVALLQTADSGDDIQMIKAGVLEIADIVVVNKADMPGTDRTVRGLKEMLANTMREGGWHPPVIQTEASRPDCVEELARTIDRHGVFIATSDAARVQRRRSRLLARVLQITDARWQRGTRRSRDIATSDELDAVLARHGDPYELADRIAERVVHQSFGRNAPRRFIIA